jgi:hypothetical protein
VWEFAGLSFRVGYTVKIKVKMLSAVGAQRSCSAHVFRVSAQSGELQHLLFPGGYSFSEVSVEFPESYISHILQCLKLPTETSKRAMTQVSVSVSRKFDLFLLNSDLTIQ